MTINLNTTRAAEIIASRPASLCAGFMVTRADVQRGLCMETLFAIRADGVAVASEEHVRGNDFDSRARKWSRIDQAAIPGDAEFCGNYHLPAVLAAA